MKKVSTSTSLHDAPSTVAGSQESAQEAKIVPSGGTAETRAVIVFQRTFVTKKGQGTMQVRFAPDQACTSSSTA